MKLRLAALSLALLAGTALAEPTCHAPKDKWMKQADFKAKMQAEGYRVKTLKVTNGCYEIYGHDKNGKRVELSFNPETGALASE